MNITAIPKENYLYGDPTGSMSASEMNQIINELQNTIEMLGGTLSDINDHQIYDELISNFQSLSEKGAISGYASLNSSQLVVENPANATATPTAGKLPIADSSGKLDGWVMSPIGNEIIGLNTSNNSSDANNDIDIAAGRCLNDDRDVLITLATGLTKRLDAAWSAGTNQGGLDTGSKAVSTTYHVFLIKNPTTSAVDVLFSTSLSSPVMPSGYTKKRRIASIMTNGSGNIIGYIQFGKTFLLKDRTEVRAFAVSANTNRTNLALVVPIGINVKAAYSVYISIEQPSNLTLFLRFSNPAVNDISTWGTMDSFSACNESVDFNSANVELCTITNTSSQISFKASSTEGYWGLSSIGWEDFTL